MNNQATVKRISLATTFLLGLILLGYFLEREQTILVASIYSMLFAVYILVCRWYTKENLNWWIGFAILCRIILLFSIPHLSDDFYRFIWDGLLQQNGYHPFAEIPIHHIEQGINLGTNTEELFNKLNSKGYFTIYPPLMQGVFFLATWCFPDSILGAIVVMRLLALAAEIVSIYVIKRLLTIYRLDVCNVLYYALNPLVILELVGNLHHESFLILFLVLTLYYLSRNRFLYSGLSFGLAVSAKLIPIIFIPFLVWRIPKKALIIFGLAALITTSVLALPLLDTTILSGMRSSLGYYFNLFEFNASLYYLLNGVVSYFYEFNTIGFIGPFMGILATLAILVYTFTSKSKQIDQIPIHFCLILTIYYFCSLTIHPWYITTLVGICSLTRLKYPIIWSYLVFLTYTGYTQSNFTENLWIVGLEYLVVMGYLVYEVWFSKQDEKGSDHILQKSYPGQGQDEVS